MGLSPRKQKGISFVDYKDRLVSLRRSKRLEDLPFGLTDKRTEQFSCLTELDFLSESMSQVSGELTFPGTWRAVKQQIQVPDPVILPLPEALLKCFKSPLQQWTVT